MTLSALCEEYWEVGLEADPVGATALGDRRYDHRMEDLSLAAREAVKQRLAGIVSRVESVNEEALSDRDQVTRGELLGALQRDLDRLEVDLESWNVNHMFGDVVQLLQIPGMQPLRDEAEVHSYLARVGAMADYLGTRIEGMRRAYEAGRVTSRAPLERTIKQVEGLMAKPSKEWSLGRHLAEDVDGVPGEVLKEARYELGRLLEEELRPAFGAYLAVLRDELRPRARDEENPGILHGEGGPEAYRKLVRIYTSLDLSPEEIHEVGKQEVARILSEICRLGGKLFGTTVHSEIQARLREDPELHFDTPESIIAAAEGAISRAEEAMIGAFGLKPEDRCAVRPIPAEEAPDSTIGYYRGAAPDGSRPGQYFVNTYAPETRRRFENEVLAFHEAVPGHHLQISIAQGLGELPQFRRHGGVTAYLEGWALYAESLADELGLYTSDLDRLGALYFDAKRACRLVADTGLHALGWSRQQAIDFMVENSLMAGHAVAVEIDRYTVLPGQALSYKLGQLEILRLRKVAEQALGEAFSLPEFHDRILEAGAVSLPVLAARVEGWAERVAV